jgi:hypothetical protein
MIKRGIYEKSKKYQSFQRDLIQQDRTHSLSDLDHKYSLHLDCISMREGESGTRGEG